MTYNVFGGTLNLSQPTGWPVVYNDSILAMVSHLTNLAQRRVRERTLMYN